jgi:hypothetical protein
VIGRKVTIGCDRSEYRYCLHGVTSLSTLQSTSAYIQYLISYYVIVFIATGGDRVSTPYVSGAWYHSLIQQTFRGKRYYMFTKKVTQLLRQHWISRKATMVVTRRGAIHTVAWLVILFLACVDSKSSSAVTVTYVNTCHLHLQEYVLVVYERLLSIYITAFPSTYIYSLYRQTYLVFPNICISSIYF